MVALTNDIFKSPMPSHMYRAYSVLPAGSKPTNTIEVMLSLRLSFIFYKLNKIHENLFAGRWR